MPRNDEWQTRIKAVEREYVAIRLATDQFQDAMRLDPSILPAGGVIPKEIDRAADNLQGTYIIRLFAEFESGLRQYWGTMRKSHPRTRDLLDGLAAMCDVPDGWRDDAHAVREYRNGLVHEREEAVEKVIIAKARGHLCRFFSRLPLKW